jgi:ribosome-associated heat shock protein Hsp15
MTSANTETAKLRVDKWLWAARFFKTRSVAAQAIEGGKVKLNGQRVKPAKEVHAGDMLAIQAGDYEWVVTVRALSARRGPAEEARKLYEESAASQARRQAQIAARSMQNEPAAQRHGRPTKRDRRRLRDFTSSD